MRHFSNPLLLFCAVLCAAPAIAHAQAVGNNPATSDPNAISLQGRIVSFNLNDRGIAEGMIVQSQGQLGQVNFPNEFTDAKALAIGDLIEITILPDGGSPGPGRGRGPQPADGRGPSPPPPPPQPDHAVFRLLALRDARGNQYNVPAPPQRSFAHVQGVVQTINYDRRGIPNGAHLASGDFVSLGGPDAQQIQLAPGMNLAADGPAQAMPDGHLALHAEQINGIALGPGTGRGDPPPPPEGGAPPPPPDANAPGGDAPPPPPDGGPQG